MSEQRLNIELFKKIRDRIATIPESYDQSEWCTESDKAPCGTAACLAGEAIICASKSVNAGVRRLRLMTDKDISVPVAAAKLLGLPKPVYRGGYNETARLFFADAEGWPEPFRSRFQKAKTYRGQASAAVAYLDNIIQAGKVLE